MISKTETKFSDITKKSDNQLIFKKPCGKINVIENQTGVIFMDKQVLEIRRLRNIVLVRDEKGHNVTFEGRHENGFIITLSGRIKFTFDDKVIYTDSTHGVFIPKGMGYNNECLETAESIVINFATANSRELSPRQFVTPDREFVMDIYDKVLSRSSSKTESDHYYILSKLYQLADKLFCEELPKDPKTIIAQKAYYYMQRNAARSELQICDVSQHCNVSSVYLRKIFKTVFGRSPFEVLTEIRMNNARQMIFEMMPIKEIALDVGYSDVYQFSRAYKKHFGHAPAFERK